MDHRRRCHRRGGLGGDGVVDYVKGQMMDLTKLVKPLVWQYLGTVAATWIANGSAGDYQIIDLGQNWDIDRYVLRISGCRLSAHSSAEAAQAAAQADHAGRVLAALDVEAVKGLVAFVDDFANAKIEVLRYDRGRSSPEDDPDPVVNADQVWGWQEDARETLACLKGEQP